MNDKLFDIDKKIIVITGGLGQLGAQFSKTLLENGAKVVILDSNNMDKKNNLLEEYIDKNCLLFVKTDVTSKKSLEQSLQLIKKKWGDVPYGLINNAALDSPPNAPSFETGPFETFPEDSWERVMDVNVKGVFLACQVFGREMANAGRGSIVNIGSIYGMISPDHRIYEYKNTTGDNPFFKPVVYSASKSALINLTKYIAVYWAKDSVRVNLITLGGILNNQDEEFIKN